ncbi:MAG: bifunctional (p)ppGpp synthetase/guanosine-3',5'-bis(diphosphate) 3'-pyrophosphohydrolase [Leptospiraceae bacterium]|nr:bifunctional (p)ppGpp synthetase/guanosine-3',5'-bis(diphosphate) 3'-pyrophosphohydrolase [Leptospiraceae bacterium]
MTIPGAEQHSYASQILGAWKQLLRTARERVKQYDQHSLQQAFRFAHRAHRDQRRLSGEPYIIHPLAVAQTLAEQGLDQEVVIAGLLHDVVEDTRFGVESIARHFGAEVKNLVEAVTKISTVKKKSRSTMDPEHYSRLKRLEAAENIRLMLLATARDVRVILIKLADKRHNMQTLKHQKAEKIERIAAETLTIYAPIAGRLGMFRLKSELEDNAFRALRPQDYSELERELAESLENRTDYINKIKEILRQRLAEINIEASVDGRAKHLYSIYQKMEQQNKDLTRIYDLRGVRILVAEVRDCYGVLGIVHTLWPPIQGRFKDYIAMPKSNGYRSLHTTVMGPDNRPLEIQIRTYAMNQIAEHGVAAHWIYKTRSQDQSDPGQNKWLNRLVHFMPEYNKDSGDFIEDLRTELNPDEVYIFTPRGDVIDMPMGSTVLDLAFQIHTEIGLTARGAQVNDRIVPLRYELKSGDRVEILTGKKPRPSPNWLRYLKSRHARQKLRSYLRQKQEDDHPQTVSSSTADTIKDLQGKGQAAGENLDQLGELRIRRKKTAIPTRVPIEIAGVNDIPVRYAGCCTPVPGDRIIGFVTRGRGVTIHRVDCPLLPNRDSNDVQRIVNVSWEGLTEKYPVPITIEAEDRQGIYLDLVAAITKTYTNILKAEANIPRKLNEKNMNAHFIVEVEHVDQLQEIFDSLYAVDGVRSVERMDKKKLKQVEGRPM